MPAKKTFSCKTCGECLVWFPEYDGAVKGQCRLLPPTPYSAYDSQYPVTRENTAACFAGIKQPAPAKKRKVVKK
jgi:hypothetical protein